MKKKLKKVFSINLEPGYRNYTVKDLIDIKGKTKLSQILVSSSNEAKAAEEAGVDLLLARADDNFRSIRLAASKTFITAAIPFIKYSSKEKIIEKALEVTELGADSIHCGSWNINFMKHLNDFRIPFQGHAGLVPRLSTWIGGVRAYGKNLEEAIQLYKNIKDIEVTGAWGVELECIPEELVEQLTKTTKMLTISIGSGKKADAQFLFAEDILGNSNIDFPRHAKMYRNFKKIEDSMQEERISAFKEFADDVKKLKFPQKKHSIKIDKKELNKFKEKLNNLPS
mgnify:CR=1 FL=1|tara:strand:+ start:15283 stop:16131 length:849 start_codon:yes stop_codon:yes gene_type:complete